MKVSLDWLSEYVTFMEKSPERVACHLTLATAEVERVEVQGAQLDLCVVGKVLEVRKHPNADKLSLCVVQTDRGKKQVVCGGSNLREGILIAFAHVGATVKWHGTSLQEIKKADIRGEKSEGMICAAEELDLSDRFPHEAGEGDRPIVKLEGGMKVGLPLREALGLTDTVFHIDNHAITHRADLFSHIGIARECVALGIARWRKKEMFRSPRFAKTRVPFTLVVNERRLMPRYCACALAIDALGETPEWMKRRLRAVGWRSLNLPIDITNYVASEVGVPLHSFDMADIRGTVHMRGAREGERIVTLDHKEFPLPAGALVLSDDAGIFDLLGIMGGLRSSMKEGTRQVYLHSASLDPLAIRRTVIATGRRTDAATVYEKGVQAITTEQGFYRALELFLALVPGARITSRMESAGSNGVSRPIAVSLARVSSLLGVPVGAREAGRSLSALGCTVRKKGKEGLLVTPPLHRLGDLKIPADLVEEIARMRRFDVGEPAPPCATLAPPHAEGRTAGMRALLRERGFSEVVTLSFLGEALLRRSGFPLNHLPEIEHPLGEDLKYLRPSLLPRLLECALNNLDRAEDQVRHFEIGHVFVGGNESISLAFLVAAKHAGALREEPFLEAKRVLLEMLAGACMEADVAASSQPAPFMHPARTLSASVSGKALAMLYEVHPAISRAWGFPQRIAVAELSLETFLSLPKKDALHRFLPAFPLITYDVTVAVPPRVPVASLLASVRGLHPLLRDVRTRDLFQKGRNEPRAVTVRCTYGSSDRTLTEEEVKPIQEKVERALWGAE